MSNAFNSIKLIAETLKYPSNTVHWLPLQAWWKTSCFWHSDRHHDNLAKRRAFG